MRERQMAFVEKVRECEEMREMKRMERKETVGNCWRKMKRREHT